MTSRAYDADTDPYMDTIGDLCQLQQYADPYVDII